MSGLLVRGHGKIELFDERALRKLDEVPFENLLMPGGVAFAKWYARQDYQADQVTTNSNNAGFRDYRNDLKPVTPLECLGLWEDATAPSSSQLYFTGGQRGWANKEPYVGADTKRGTVNYAESAAGSNFVRWVFDWPTHAGNGAFRSLGWYYGSNSALLRLDPSISRSAPATSTAPFGLNGNNGWGFQTVAFDPATNLLWIASRTNHSSQGYVWSLPWGGGAGTTGALPSLSTATLRFFISEWTGAVFVANNNLFVAHYYDSEIEVFPTSTNVGNVHATGTIINPGILDGINSSTEKVLTGDGTNLFLSALFGTRIHKLNATGTSLGSIDTSAYGSIRAMVYRAGHDELWVFINDRTVLILGASGAGFGTLKGSFAATYDPGYYDAFQVGDEIWTLTPNSLMRRWDHTVNNYIGTRALLPSEVTKTNLQTMKITYQFDFS